MECGGPGAAECEVCGKRLFPGTGFFRVFCSARCAMADLKAFLAKRKSGEEVEL